MRPHRATALGSLLIVSLISTSPRGAVAQRVDSVAAARAAMREASALAGRGDTVGALAALTRATTAWPRQGAYLISLGRFAARAGRNDVARDALSRATAMGFGWRIADPAFAAAGTQDALRDVAAAAATLGEPVLRGAVVYVHADSTMHPEGVAVDSATGRLFLSSVRQGKIIVVDPGGRARDFSAGHDAVMGMAIDRRRGLLWAATSATPERDGYTTADSNRAAVVAFDLVTGAERRRWALPRNAPHMLGDVILAPDGSAWATDSRTAAIWRADLRDSAGAAVQLSIAGADLVSPQGVAFSPDGRRAWIADWTTGLHRLDVATGQLTPVAGDPMLFMLGIDGLYRETDRTLLAIQNGVSPTRVVRLHLDAAGGTLTRIEVLERGVTPHGEPTLGAVVGTDFYYIANAPWDAYGNDGRLRAGAVLERGMVRKVPLGGSR